MRIVSANGASLGAGRVSLFGLGGPSCAEWAAELSTEEERRSPSQRVMSVHDRAALPRRADAAQSYGAGVLRARSGAVALVAAGEVSLLLLRRAAANCTAVAGLTTAAARVRIGTGVETIAEVHLAERCAVGRRAAGETRPEPVPARRRALLVAVGALILTDDALIPIAGVACRRRRVRALVVLVAGVV